MLVVIAAALGDGDSIKHAGRLLAWSDFPALRICAAKTLRRLQDARGFEWFLDALDDDHFVLNGACGSLRERFIRCAILPAHRCGRSPHAILKIARWENGSAGWSFWLTVKPSMISGSG